MITRELVDQVSEQVLLMPEFQYPAVNAVGITSAIKR